MSHVQNAKTVSRPTQELRLASCILADTAYNQNGYHGDKATSTTHRASHTYCARIAMESKDQNMSSPATTPTATKKTHVITHPTITNVLGAIRSKIKTDGRMTRSTQNANREVTGTTTMKKNATRDG